MFEPCYLQLLVVLNVHHYNIFSLLLLSKKCWACLQSHDSLFKPPLVTAQLCIIDSHSLGLCIERASTNSGGMASCLILGEESFSTFENLISNIEMMQWVFFGM